MPCTLGFVRRDSPAQSTMAVGLFFPLCNRGSNRSRGVTYGLGRAFSAIRIRPRGTRLRHRHQPIKLLAMKVLFQICTVIVATFCLLQQATAQDPVKKQSPDKYIVTFQRWMYLSGDCFFTGS